MAGEIDIKFDFIEKHEGKRKLKGYVPVCTPKSVSNANNKACFGKEVGSAIGQSGVTVGTGFDLGQFNEADLQRIGISGDIIKKVKRFLGKKKKDAITELESFNKENKTGFELTSQDVQQIELKLKAHFYNGIKAKYDKKYGGGAFDRLPTEAKTVVFSMLYQYGIYTKNTKINGSIDDIMNARYDEAIKKLEGIEEYKSRRTDEANLLKTIGASS